jgi:hypothetical protein
MSRLSDALATEPVLSASYALLPPSSYHMTTLDIISHQKYHQAVAAHATSDLTAISLLRMKSNALHELTQDMQLYVASVANRLELAGVLSSVPWTSFEAKSVELEPWDKEIAAALENWRVRAAQCIADFGGHQNAPIVCSVEQWKANQSRGHYYRFYMSVAYVNFLLGCSQEPCNVCVQRQTRCLSPWVQLFAVLRTFVTFPRWVHSTP